MHERPVRRRQILDEQSATWTGIFEGMKQRRRRQTEWTNPFCELLVTSRQCDRLTRLFFLDTWPFTTMKIYSIALKIALVVSQFCRITKNLQNLPNNFITLPKWRNFAQFWSHCFQAIFCNKILTHELRSNLHLDKFASNQSKLLPIHQNGVDLLSS